MAITAFACGCGGKSDKKSIDSPLTQRSDTTKSNKVNGSPYSKRAVDSMIRVGAISPDSVPDAPPTQSEERERLKSKYDQVETIDSIFVAGTDTLHFHSKYYCLKNVDLVEPKSADPDQLKPKEFITHPFVANIWLIHNRDTVLDKQFRAADFNPFFEDNFGGNLKKYGSILDLHLSKQNKKRDQIALVCSIAIPATDIGTGMTLIIDKSGNYKIMQDQ